MKKLYKFLAVALMAVMAMGSQTVNAQSLSPSTKWHWDKGTIVIENPERPAGQEHVLGLKADPIQTVRIGFVGLGMRGPSAVIRFCQIPGVEIVGLCDYEASVLKLNKCIFAMQVWHQLLSIRVKRVMKNSASVRM